MKKNGTRWQKLALTNSLELNEMKEKISERQLAILRVLWSYGPEQIVFMKYIATLTDLDKKAVRRAVRVLARKGLARLDHVWDLDSEYLAGSGYRITTKGCRFMQTRGEAPA